MKRALAMLAAVALSACATVRAGGDRPTAGFGQVAAIGALRIRPLRIVEDSRCAADVVCVWAGRLVLRAELNGPGLRDTRDLTLGEPVPVAGGKLGLVAVEPVKLAASKQALPYSFTFSLTAE